MVDQAALSPDLIRDLSVWFCNKMFVTWLFSAKQHYVHRELQDFLPQKTLFLHHLSSLQRALNKKSSAYKPSPRHLLSGDTKGSASAYTIWAYFGNNQRVSSSVFQRSPIIIVVDYQVLFWGCLQCSPTAPSQLQQMGPHMKTLSPRSVPTPFFAHLATSSYL